MRLFSVDFYLSLEQGLIILGVDVRFATGVANRIVYYLIYNLMTRNSKAFKKLKAEAKEALEKVKTDMLELEELKKKNGG
jgi:mannosyltransferase OCH1-like enzyme